MSAFRILGTSQRIGPGGELSRLRTSRGNICSTISIPYRAYGMEKPALELVLQALDALYRNEDPAGKEKASQWLMQLQASVSVLFRAHLTHSVSLLMFTA